MDTQKQRIERITHYEALLDGLLAALQGEGLSAEERQAAQDMAEKLAAYYESPAWREDFAADEAGLLPKELKRGVLSEDGVYNALEEYREWAEGRRADREA